MPTAPRANTRSKLVEALRTDARVAAQALLGCMLVRRDRFGLRSGIVVETEAYLQHDPASHSYRGKSYRNASMFGRAGTAYVYRIHRSFCLNVVTGPEGDGQAVLIRALEPVDGIARMRRVRRHRSVGRGPLSDFAITNGPGKLCQALEIDLRFDGVDLLANGRDAASLILLPRAYTPEIACSTRIGISRGADAELRFFVPGNPWVSR